VIADDPAAHEFRAAVLRFARARGIGEAMTLEQTRLGLGPGRISKLRRLQRVVSTRASHRSC
jgi:hypothetical protein